MLQLLRIEKVRSADDVQFTFFAVMQPYGQMPGAPSAMRANVSAQAIMDYWTFQHEILLQCGSLFADYNCEGRGRLPANENWKAVVDSALLMGVHHAAANAAQVHNPAPS